MEDSTAPGKQAAINGSQNTSNKSLMSSKPLHRFLQRDPRSLGIVLLIFGCAELLMGFTLSGLKEYTSNDIYIPFWQGALFVTCGILSICTDMKPSKKMVTVSLSMYVVSILGSFVSFGYRVYVFIVAPHTWYRSKYGYGDWNQEMLFQMVTIEAVLFLSSLSVSGILIFLSTAARFALKSSHTQILVNYVPRAEPRTGTSSD